MNIIGFLVGVIRLSSNWLFRNIAYVYVEFTRNVPLLLQIILWYAILIQLPRIKQAIQFFDNFYIANRGLFGPRPIFEEGFNLVFYTIILVIIVAFFIRRWAKKRQDQTGKQFPTFSFNTSFVDVPLFPK